MLNQTFTLIIDISEQTHNSSSILFPDWAKYLGIFFPTCTASTFKLQTSFNGTDYSPVVDPKTGKDLIIAAAAATPCYVDVSDHVRAIGKTQYFRVRSIAEQEADRAITVTIRG